jgi:hypothetical protein
VIAGSIESVTAEIRRQRPAVVINTIGPFTATAVPIVRACLPGSYYIDLASEVAATLGLNGAAAGADGRKVLATASQAVSFEGLAGKRARLPRWSRSCCVSPGGKRRRPQSDSGSSLRAHLSISLSREESVFSSGQKLSHRPSSRVSCPLETAATTASQDPD